jgi:uncharacterized protein
LKKSKNSGKDETMKCPRCRTELRTIQYEGAQIETCPGCGGEWLDDGELKHIVHTVEETFPQEMKDSLDAINVSIFTIDESVENQLTCPQCPEVQMNRFNYACSSGIALDKCPQCKGIWLDKDEIEKVQLLVEEWRGKLQEDREKFAPVLQKVEQEMEEEDKDNFRISRFGFVNAVLRRIVDHV